MRELDGVKHDRMPGLCDHIFSLTKIFAPTNHHAPNQQKKDQTENVACQLISALMIRQNAMLCNANSNNNDIDVEVEESDMTSQISSNDDMDIM